ncbi:ABC-type nitrate/sulfonate/bicarbonate transport system, periplasmic component [Desulfitobacterium dichloroeliminans LMG P-21439]|uniref:ABC-type nitrate/sulfonate/bicarbonate transport system, periplasmic component n=1 Tax=Desulfitobacterium dichloroeliminans (strain LMG P-21439 / DCA1) TaxID=871963 RepID=L0FBH6_DESDL|nr:ABC transporter substrate-binding protein [Desulfitobacterium dichloroeliminans]AGA70380.1 ABC-type nitrate/sulfonate/bicarbonate transport system, periplasmic component [Desulfitobacterium dichloroeliminans LMG P-21439]
MKRKFFLAILVITFLCLILVGCNTSSEVQANKLQIKIAEQYGLAYAPLQIMKEKQLLESKLPGIEVSWRQLGNTTAIREAMLAEELDVGFMAIPPFLIGWDKGMEWKIACGLSTTPIGLVVNKDSIQSIEDFTPEDRIALPQPGSIQHILLAMASDKLWGDSKRLDNQLVTLDHPDGMNALLARSEISAHFTTPPYLFMELEEPGIHQILDGKEVMGEDFTFSVGVTSEKFYEEQPAVYEAFLEALADALNFMESNPTETVEILAKAYQMDEAELVNYLERSDTAYGLEVQGVMEFADFMQKYGLIKSQPANLEEVIWDRK